MEVNQINPKNIVSKGNVRAFVDKDEYKSLKESIKTLGIGQAITVCADKDNDKQYVVIDGHQRLKIAKELKLDVIPVHYIDAPNGETEVLQHSLNVQRVNMTLFDEITMMQDLTAKRKSMKEIASMYGKSLPEVEMLIQCGNVHPKILNRIDWTSDPDRLKEALANLCLFDQSLQFEAWTNKYDDTDMLEDWELKQIYRELENKVFPETMTKELFTQDELDEYAKTYEGEMNTSLSLFNVSKDLSPAFFTHCFKSKYSEIAQVLEEKREKHESDYWHIRFDEYRYREYVKSIPLKKILGYKDPVKTLSAYDGFNNDFMNPKFLKLPKVEEKEEKKKEKSKERPKYYAQTKKFFFTIQPLVQEAISTIDPLACKEEIPRVYKWLKEDSDTTHLINSYETRGKSVKEKTCKEIIDKVTKDWYSWIITGVSMERINKLFIRLEMDTIQKLVEDKYAKDLTFRDAVLTCMNTTNLMELGASKGKKTDMIAWILNKDNKKFPFSDIYKAEDGWYNLMSINTEKR